MKIDREAAYKKYDGHCAYCGVEIDIKDMQVDHFWPQFLAYYQPDLDGNRPENLMPSCRKCNICKHAWRPEEFRKEMALQVSRLRKNAQFDRALRFGQIEITEKPIVFYFETREAFKLFLNPTEGK